MHAECMHHVAVHAFCFTEMADCSREYPKLRKRRERDCGHDRERKCKQVRIHEQQSRARTSEIDKQCSNYVGKGCLPKCISKQQQPIISKKHAWHQFCTVCTPSNIICLCKQISSNKNKCMCVWQLGCAHISGVRLH